MTERELIFVDEIDFPARHPDEKGCAPDYTVFVDGRCWVIELKTEPGSHRPRQVPDYFERARHYHPDLRVDLTYLTAGLRRPFEPPLRDWERYSHIEWSEVIELIEATWGNDVDAELRSVAKLLVRGLDHIAAPLADWWTLLGYTPAPTARTSRSSLNKPSVPQAGHADPDEVDVEDVLELATATGVDGRQRAVGLEAADSKHFTHSASPCTRLVGARRTALRCNASSRGSGTPVPRAAGR